MVTERLDARVLWLALACLAGCGSADLDDPEAVRTWATTGSAVGVWAHAHEAIAFADGHGSFADPKCPVTNDDGTTARIAGGCTDSTGVIWKGTATVVRSSTGDRTLDFDAWGHFASADQEATKTGTFHLTKTGPTSHDFDASLVDKGGMTTTIHYAGHVEGDWDTPTVWSGSGDVERDGLVAPTGKVQVSTVEERVDDAACSGQPVSGSTRIEADGDAAEVIYDGGTDCDADKAAHWTFNGEDRGRVTGITCSTQPAGGAPLPLLPLALLVGAAIAASVRRHPRALRSGATADTLGG